jgi:hypothetical protein
MTDPLRDDRPESTSDSAVRDREIRIEELLLTGLDHYFNAQYEWAINVWTRVLFLDRGHARARAYIERARGAVAERQREGDELLHAAVEAADRGDAAMSRHLLASAVESGGASDDAVTLMQRLDRLDRTPSDPPRWPAAPFQALHVEQPAASEATVARGRAARTVWRRVALVLGAAVVAGGFAWRADFWPGTADVKEPPPGNAASATDPLPVPAPSSGTLRRAQALANGGRLHDAIDQLDQIRPDDRLRREADELRARIQRQLLAVSRATQPAGGTAATR